ncbi:putative phospholipid-transporting ATPase IF [Liparis tanakae]|uniref:Putative phospholipid-transporting ATPase IF n=1 Tax=Liparis tanakae TaxID=230148 RepID=A0A4Z2GIP6_9TELE|nr:putative phospholipid-transporting ATPase IF [Liparis tanakae]
MLRWIRQQLGFDPPHQSDTRTVYVANRFPQNGHYIPQRFADNRIISSKYTIWNFIPKNLFEQFRRIANFYFLIIFLVQLMIDTPTSPVTSGLPLFFVITVTAIKQGYEDWLRYKADNEVNGAPVFVVRSGSLVQTKSKNIRVGDIVRVAKDETFPADLALLSSDRADGTCHITTASLDGETNLKTHFSVAETAVCQSVSQLEALEAVVECQQPDADLYRFVGRITVTQHGEEIVRSMNTFLIIYLGILLFEAILSTILKYAWQAEDKWDEPFYNQETEQERNSSPILKFISDFLAFLVLYNFIIPISLYVTVEMQKFMGSFFIGWDLDLYHEESDQKAQVNTSDLNEELGQIGDELLFLKAVSLCHTVQISYDQPDCPVGGGDSFSHANGFSSSHMEYYASSPDEKALVEAAKRIGVAFTRSSGDTKEIKTYGKTENGEIEKTRLHVDEFALKGLRTLVVACRHFSPEEYVDVDKHLNAARTALQQREERLQEAFAYIERDMQLLGATGVEDKLQDKVQETIDALRMAGIKVWVLTGDKHETAVSVSLSCGHFHRSMNILELLQQRSDNECAEQLRRLDRRIKEDHVIQHGFKFLSKLLLVHGHFYYIRIATLVQYFFYKTLYDSVYLTLYNICFTSLPILVYSLFEQLVHPHVLQSKPALYRDISRNSLLSFRTFLYWTLLGFLHAFIFFFGSYLLMGEDTSLMGNGQMFGNWTLGTLVFTVMVITVTLKDMYFVFVQLLSSGSAWFAIIIIIITCLFPDVVKKVFYRHLQPTITQKSQAKISNYG